MKLNVPNFLTILRIMAIPALVVVLLSNFKGHDIIGFWIFVIASLTDMLDGFWARRKQMITVFGQLLDPIADKLLITSSLICLVERKIVPAWMAVIIIGREFAVTGFRMIASSRGFNIPASPLGKIKMNAETVTLALLMLGPGLLGKFYVIPSLGLWLILFLAIASGIEYYARFGPAVLSKDA